MRAEQRAFLVKHLGEERTRQLEEREAMKEVNIDLIAVGLGWKEAGMMSFESLDTERTLSEFSFIVQNILTSDADAEAKVAAIEAAIAALPERLGVKEDREVSAYIAGSADAALGQLVRLADGSKEAPAVEEVTGALVERVKAVVDERGNRRPTASIAMMAYGSHVPKHPLGRLWASLGLNAGQISAHVERKASKEVGTSRERVYQLATGTKEEQGRLLAAIHRAARATGRTEVEIEQATKAILGRGEPGSPAEKYVQQWL